MIKPVKRNPIEAHRSATVKPSSFQPGAKELRQELQVNVPLEKAFGSPVRLVEVKTERKQMD
ncbi:MAG: hypothetical protein F4Z62_06985 [Rhodothermaceae bacterium]|nr:hypothetical protein [Rhodothermaceae bacterium]MYE63513.1 hypothetical protein [Rhodothermaceae bacterium]